MKLSIDTSSSEKIILSLDNMVFETEARREKSQGLLPFLENILSSENKKLTDISEIEVNQGPGSFTGLRVGLSIAHTLGWILHVPVNGKQVSKGELVELTY